MRCVKVFSLLKELALFIWKGQELMLLHCVCIY